MDEGLGYQLNVFVTRGCEINKQLLVMVFGLSHFYTNLNPSHEFLQENHKTSEVEATQLNDAELGSRDCVLTFDTRCCMGSSSFVV